MLFLPKQDHAQIIIKLGFPGSSTGKESTCNVGEPASIPGVRKIPWRRDRLHTPVFLGFPGGSDGKESIFNVGDLDWKDSLEEGMATHSSILAWRIPMDGGTWRITIYRIS